MVARAEGVAGRQRDDDLLLPEQRGGELVAEGVRVQGGERAVELVGLERGEDAVLGVLDHVDRDARVRRAEVGEHAEQVVRAGRVDAADPQLAAQQAGELLELGVQAVDLGEHALRVAEDDAPLGGELHLPARAPEDLDAELGLEPPDLLRDRRLGEVQLLGGLRERPVAGDGGDGAKVTELHDAMVPGGEPEVEVALLRPAISARDGSRVYAFGSARRRRASSIAAVSGVIPPAAAS